jgi:hypothetical protein
MADNYVTDPGVGGVTFASDEDGGSVHWPYVKLVFGAADTQTIVSGSNPMPVNLVTDSLSGNLDVNLAASGITLNTSAAVTSVVPGVGATNLGKAEDAAHSSGDVGVMNLAVRADADGSLVDTSGDYAPLQVDANGYLKVEIFDGGGSHTVDGTITANAGTGTFTVAGTVTADAGTGTFTVTDDGSFTLAANSGVDVGDVTINNASGAGAVNIQDGGNSITVDGTVTADAGTGTFTVTDDGSFVLAANSGVDIGDVTINNAAGASAVNIQDGGNSITVDGAVAAAGDVAHDAADSGNPVKVGAVARTANPTAVAGGDRVDVYADDLGRLVLQPFAPRDLQTHNQITLTDTTETSLIAAGGAGVFKDLVWLFMTNTSATQVRVDIRYYLTGTVRLSVALAANGGGANVNIPIQLKQASAATAWTAQLSASVSSVYITAIAVDNN